MEKLRVSSYMIPVKLEKEEGKYMLIHGYTGGDRYCLRRTIK